MIYNPEYRYQYEKEKLKRVALDLQKETEYKPLKDYCDINGFPVAGLIRKLIRYEVQKPGMNLQDILEPEQLQQLETILKEKRNTTIQDWLKDSIQKFIEKNR